MTDATEKALDLADKWAQQIGEKLNSAAPGVADVAMEAVIVKSGAAILTWIMYLVVFFVLLFFMRRVIKVLVENTDERGDIPNKYFPHMVSAFLGVVAMTFSTATVISNFPSKEIVGIVAPRGYVALMVLDSIKK